MQRNVAIKGEEDAFSQFMPGRKISSDILLREQMVNTMAMGTSQ